MGIMKMGKMKTGEFALKETLFKDWDSVMSKPGGIRIEVLKAGEVTGTVHGIVNMRNEKAAGLEDKKLVGPLLAILVKHDTKGDFLIDTGFDSSFAERPWGNFEGILKKGAFKFKVEKGQAIEEQLAERQVKIQGVFCTHFHEHQGGAPSLPDNIPFVFGKGEKEIDFFPIAYSRFLKDKTDLQVIDFDKAGDMPIVGKAADIFGDGSFWAISTPGHTKGHISYMINGKEGKHLVTGDICMCRKGFDLGVESGGKYAENMEKNKESFDKIKKFMDIYPQVKPVFGHESEEFPIVYQDT